MRSYEVPDEEWVSFFDRFSKEHAGWPVTIEVLDPTGGPQPVAQDLPLRGISIDKVGTRPSSILVGAGDRPEASAAHVVDMPLHVRVVRDEDDASGTIQIEPARGPAALVHYHRPA